MRRRQANIVVIVSSTQWNRKISEGAFIFMHLLCFHETVESYERSRETEGAYMYIEIRSLL